MDLSNTSFVVFFNIRAKITATIALIAFLAILQSGVTQICHAQIMAASPMSQSTPQKSKEKLHLVTPDAMRTKTVAQLLLDLESANAAQRSTAAYYIGELGAKASAAVATLINVITRDQSKWVRRSAAKALGKIGTKEAISGLKIAAADRDPWVVHSAQNALSSYGPQPHFRLASRYKLPSYESEATVFYRAKGNDVIKLR